MRLSVALVLSLEIVALALASCTPIGITSSASAASTDVITEVVTDKTVYIPDEPINVNVTATNNGTEQVTLMFPTMLQQYYVVSDLEGTEIFDIRQHIAISPMISYMTLDPGGSESRTFSDIVSWKQVNDSGAKVPIPAYYVIWGLLYSYSQDYARGAKTIVISDSLTQPDARFNVSSQSSTAGEDLIFDASSSLNTIGQADLLEYRWDWTGDGTFDTDWTTDPVATHIYDDPGDYTVMLNVRDPAGLDSSASTTVSVSAAVPEFSTVVLPLVGVSVLVLICARKGRRL